MAILLSALQWFGGTVVVVGLIGIATWQLFKWLGSKWIEDQFQHRMEAYKAEQLRELERLRAKINQTFDRTKRLHDKEFEHLPGIWAKLVDCYEFSGAYLYEIKTYPTVDKLRDDAFENFLSTKIHDDLNREFIRDADDRQSAVDRVLEFQKYNDTSVVNNEFASAFKKNGIFIKPELKADISRLYRQIAAAVLEQHLNMKDELHPPIRDKYKAYREEASELYQKIENQVQERVWSSTQFDF